MALCGLCAPDEMMGLVCVSLLTVCDVFPLHLDPSCTLQVGSKELGAEEKGAFGERVGEKETKSNILAASSSAS